VKNGVPFGTAFSLDSETRIAFAIVFGGFEGNEWDWDDMAFRERREGG
jgi:hypothetical protein